MKRKILVLDAYTNGHEASLRFMRRMGWKTNECEIVFCGTHSALLSRLTEGPAFAVLPVHNSIAGEVNDVVNGLGKLKKEGYDFKVVKELDLQIDHCLIAPKHVTNINQIERVISHEKAIQQCGNFLDSIGLTPDKRHKDDSTGNVARHVARLNSSVMMGAIASKRAAKAYDLNILKEGIQDTRKNSTHFVLVENTAHVEPITVGIIGINGRFGSVLAPFFRELGCTVIGSDKNKPTMYSNADVVKNADVVIFAITVKRTIEVIQSVIEHTREDQLLMDVTSVKQNAVEEMMRGKSQVVGLHPMFAPEVGFDGQTNVVCPARLTMPRWQTWVLNVLAATKAKIKWSEPKTHDKYMGTVQGSPQLANFINALLIMESGISTSESLTFTSPFYRVMFSLMGRLLSQAPDLYASILMENPVTVPMLEKRIEIERRLLKIIKEKDYDAFIKLFEEAREYFGKEIVRDANELFIRLLSVTKTLEGPNTAIIEFKKVQSKPGLLEKILKAFRKNNVNLTGINSVVFGETTQITMSFNESRLSENVGRALAEIQRYIPVDVKK